MISKHCNIDEFVEVVKGKQTNDVISLAIDEATQADRMFFRGQRNDTPHDYQAYSRHLKRLINYLRYEIKPHRPKDKAYHLYMANWGGLDHEYPNALIKGPPHAIQ